MPQFYIIADKFLIDEPIQIKLIGLSPNEEVTIRAEFCDDIGQTWASWAKFEATVQGEVDVETARPIDGTYHNASGMGLFWSMALQSGEIEQPVRFVNSVTKSLKPLATTLIAKRHGKTIATAVIERKFLADEVKRIDVREMGLTATLFVPLNIKQRLAVITVGGSGGGFGWAHQVAAILASRGCLAIAIAYFDWQGQDNLPNGLIEIPVECIGKAIEHLLLTGNDFSNLAIIGYSKGAELALVAAAIYPEISHVIAYVPSAVVWHGFTVRGNEQKSSWSYQGKPLPFLMLANGYFDEAGWQDQKSLASTSIPVAKIRGSILLISAANDRVWPSTMMSEMIFRRVKSQNKHQDIKHLRLEGAIHNLNVPFLPTTAFGSVEMAVSAYAERLAWQEVLGFLNLY